MITLSDYVGVWSGSKDWTPECQRNAVILLKRVNSLINDYESVSAILFINHNTDNNIAGLTYGGFRPQSCPQGAPHSAHKLGMAVDIYDPDNKLDTWLDLHPTFLEKHDLYREASASTLTWCHLSTRKPGSGKRTFIP